MSSAVMSSTGLIIEPRSLATRDSLTGRILAGDERLRVPGVRDLLTSGPPPSRASVLGPEAFGVSGPDAGAKLERVLRGEGFMVSTGHQPVLFLGPLYVVYKALTAIELAAQLEEAWEVPVLPLFWVASDDHDWAEVGQTSLVDGEGRLRTLRFEPPAGYESRPVGPVRVGEAGEAIVSELSQLISNNDFTDIYVKYVRDAYVEETNLSTGFARLLQDTLGDRGYVWLDSSTAALKTGAAELFRRMMDAPDSILAAGGAGSRRISAAGFEPPIPVLEGALPMFFDGGTGRERVYAVEGGARAGRSGPVEPMETWRRRLDDAPEAFSPNVASRPVLESHLLPIAATVLGPGEIAYWSQLPPLFESLEVQFPGIQPRAAWTLVEPKIERLLRRFDLVPGVLADGGGEVIGRLTERSRPEVVDREVERLRDAITRGLAELDSAIGEALPGLKSTAGKTRKALFSALSALSKQIDRETRHRLATQLGQIRRCADSLFPGGKPQERGSSPFYYLARYGPDVIEDLALETSAWVASSLRGTGGSLASPESDG